MADDSKPWLRPEPVNSVWLMRDGEDAVVIVERDGVMYEAIREHVDSNFSHSISAEGIRHLDNDDRVEWLDDGLEV